MATETKRGSEKLLAAWGARTLSEESVREIAAQLEKSPARVERADVVGGAAPTGVRLALSYDGDDTPWCGNDILFWLKWHRTHGGAVTPPRIIINGIPYPEVLQLELDFGHVPAANKAVEAGAELAGVGGA